MKKYLITFILLSVLAAIVFGLCQGCATVEAKDGEFEFKAATLGKDIRVDPNGVMSTVSPENVGIIEALAGFVVGWAVFGL